MTPRHNRGSTPTQGEAAVQAAAKLLLRCDGLWRDETDHARGIAVDYALDVVVLALFSNPNSNSKHAEVFANDSVDGTSGLLARVLGDFVVREQPGVNATQNSAGALLVIPPHDDELDRTLLAIATKGRAILASSVDKLTQVADAVAADTQTDLEAIVRAVIEQAPEIIEAFDGESGPLNEAKRLASLPKDRLLNLRHCLHYLPPDQRGSWVAPESPLPPSGAVASSDRNDFVEYVKKWRVLLATQVAGQKPGHAMRRDAVVMASLQWVNERFERYGVKRKLVLITSSDYLFSAARSVVTNEVGVDFGARFLRHPQAFLASKDFFSRAQIALRNGHGEQSVSLLHWLNLFFPVAITQAKQDQLSVDRTLLERIAQNNDEKMREQMHKNELAITKGSSTYLDQMVESWREVVRSLAAYRGLTTQDDIWQRRVSAFLETLKTRLRASWSPVDFAEEIRAQGQLSLDNLIVTTSQLGLFQLTGENAQIRGFPAIHFDSGYETAQAIVDELTRAFCSEKKPGVQAFLDVRQIYTTLEPVDPSNYHTLVIRALAYAGTDHWFGALTLCLTAIQICDRIPKTQRGLRLGREASYLLAVAERRLAEQPSDIDKARKALDQAVRRDEASNNVIDCRFVSERLAQDAWLLQFSFYVDHCTDNMETEPLLFELNKTLLYAETTAQGATQSWVIRQTATNALFVAFIGLQTKSRPFAELTGKAMLEKLTEYALSPDCPQVVDGGPYCDAISDLAYWVGMALWSSDEAARDTASVCLQDASLKARRLPPFDVLRLVRLRALVGTYRGAPNT